MASCRPAVLPSCRVLRATAALLLLTACEDLTISTGDTRATDELIILEMQSTAPAPSSATFFVFNARDTERNLRHGDATNTLFVELRFPAGALASLDGAPLGPGDSVRVTVRPEPGTYGVEIAPDGLRFSSTARPSVRFSYVKYGDFSVAQGSQYADQNAYAAALDVWQDVAFDRWSNIGGSGTAGTDLRTTIAESGRFIVAAPR